MAKKKQLTLCEQTIEDFGNAIFQLVDRLYANCKAHAECASGQEDKCEYLKGQRANGDRVYVEVEELIDNLKVLSSNCDLPVKWWHGKAARDEDEDEDESPMDVMKKLHPGLSGNGK